MQTATSFEAELAALDVNSLVLQGYGMKLLPVGSCVHATYAAPNGAVVTAVLTELDQPIGVYYQFRMLDRTVMLAFVNHCCTVRMSLPGSTTEWDKIDSKPMRDCAPEVLQTMLDICNRSRQDYNLTSD